MRTFDSKDFTDLREDLDVRQVNASHVSGRGTVKGLHLQLAPSHEYKIVTCVLGAVADVILDLRQDSASFGQYALFDLRAFDGRSLLIPPGVAHGMQNLHEESIVLYAHSDVYRPDLESGVHPLDESISIPWPLTPMNLSDRDKKLPTLAAFSSQHDL